MRWGYNTNGLANHRWQDALELIAECGYQSVALTVDHHCLDPCSTQFEQELQAVQESLQRLGLSSVIETGARFLLNPRAKHEPTLVSLTKTQRQRRVEFLCQCIDIAAALNSDAVSFWAGVSHTDTDADTLWNWLVAGCREVAAYAESQHVRLAFEPEPGMVIESQEQFGRLLEAVESPAFGLTIDIGHLQCVEQPPIAEYLRKSADRLWNLHIEDMRTGVHDHLRFGEGEIDFRAVLRTLQEIDYQGGVHVELSRHSHLAPQVLTESYTFLTELWDEIECER